MTESGRKKTVLVVEDHPDALDILTNLLEFLGFTVIGARHGVEGVEKALKEKPELILMDILMPLMDGREATRKIRSNPETPCLAMMTKLTIMSPIPIANDLPFGLG